MKTKPWIARYWRAYRQLRRLGRPISIARREAGKIARDWWNHVSQYYEE